MPDERKPVICPWCGWEMVAREGQDIFHGKYNAYVCDGCEAVSPIAYSEDAAYAAATATPPNLPLDKDSLLRLNPSSDAVWYVIEGWKESSQVISAHSAQDDPVYWLAPDMLLFAAKPTPEDIEAARKEQL